MCGLAALSAEIGLLLRVENGVASPLICGGLKTNNPRDRGGWETESHFRQSTGTLATHNLGLRFQSKYRSVLRSQIGVRFRQQSCCVCTTLFVCNTLDSASPACGPKVAYAFGMATNSEIQWTTHTFNPWIGCTKVSPACLNCYAENQEDKRFHRVKWGKGQPRRLNSEAKWRDPPSWNRKCEKYGVRARVFCASLADVFDAEVDYSWKARLWELIGETPHLDWLLLTKRPESIRGDDPWGNSWPENVWIGTSVENQFYADLRLPILAELPAKNRFVSAEPLLGDFQIKPEHRIDWLIVGGESGAGWRPMDMEHVRSLRDQCIAQNTAFFLRLLADPDR